MKVINANWSAPEHVHALSTTRWGGCSQAPYDDYNLALHVDDNPADVLCNREKLKQDLMLPGEPFWLNQVHSSRCLIASNQGLQEADAAISRTSAYPLVVLTADCLPIVLCNQKGSEIAIIHAGWRGLLTGIIENTLCQLDSIPNTLMAWFGPSICADCYEVGSELREQFMKNHSFGGASFSAKGNKWHFDLPQMAESILRKNGVSKIHMSNICTFHSLNEYYSYRRASKTGRIATLIWLKHNSY